MKGITLLYDVFNIFIFLLIEGLLHILSIVLELFADCMPVSS